jgi:hypothetical protein
VQYALLIYDVEGSLAALSSAEMSALYKEYAEFSRSLARGGNFKFAGELKPTFTATTVRVRNGKVRAADGPVAETREQLGGFYLIEAGDLDEAIAIAARVPSARYGSIEVRPINSERS